MPRWTRGERIVPAAGTLLVVDLLLLPWHRYSLDMEQFGLQVPGFRLDRTGVQDPYGLFGKVAMVIALYMVLHTVAAKLTAAVQSPGPMHVIAGAIVLGLVVGKLVANRDFLAIGAWAGTALAAGLAYGSFALGQDTPTGSGQAVNTA